MRNFVPRVDNDGTTLGTADKRWTKLYCMDIDVKNGVTLGNIDAGSVVQPVYIDDGSFKPCNILTTGNKAWPALPQIVSSGSMEVGKTIDFHKAANETADYALRLYVKKTSTESTLTKTNETLYCTGNIDAGKAVVTSLTTGDIVATGISGLKSLSTEKATVKNDVTISDGNLIVSKGGITVTTGGLNATNGGISAKNITASSSATVGKSSISNNNLLIVNPDVTYNVTPSTASARGVYVRDVNSTNIGALLVQKATYDDTSSGSTVKKSQMISYIRSYQPSSKTTYFDLKVVSREDGLGYASLSSTPDANDNSTKIATTAFVKTAINSGVNTAKSNADSAILAAVPKSVGSPTQPVYSNANGKITACTYTLGKSVPSNAVFTDTITKIPKCGGANQPVYFSAENTVKECSFVKDGTSTGMLSIESQNITNTGVGKSGYMRLANGLTLQWGLRDDIAGIYSGITVSFPVPFKQSVYAVVCTMSNGSKSGPTSSSASMKNGSWTLSSFKTYCSGQGGKSFSAEENFNWIAIGV